MSAWFLALVPLVVLVIYSMHSLVLGMREKREVFNTEVDEF